MKRALCIFILTTLGACQERAPDPPAPASAAAAEPPKPVDHLAAGELLAGTERAFALVLPRGFLVRARFATSVLVEGEATAVSLGAYVAARVKDGHASVQPAKAVFEAVRVPEEPARVLGIRIDETAPGFCTVQINDDTPPPDPGGDVAERMKRIGRTPDGKLEGRDKME